MPANSDQPRSTSGTEKPTIFIVDDDVSVRESIEHLIQIAGWKALVFASAELFLENAAAPGRCCLVLDINMPKLDGLELQRVMSERGIEMPTIVMSGYDDARDSHALEGGAVAFLTKPINSAEFLEKVRTALASWKPTL